MKHPNLSTLQDYFENELNEMRSALVKEHLLDCDQCTLMLSQVAKVDTKVKAASRTAVSERTKNHIYADAHRILREKRNKNEVTLTRTKDRQQQIKIIENFLRDSFNEFKLPVFQLASLSILIGMIISTIQNGPIIVKKPLSEGVVIYTHDEFDSSIEGEKE